jgi:hypothetical protein
MCDGEVRFVTWNFVFREQSVKIEWLCHVAEMLHTPGWRNINSVPNRRPTRKKQKKKKMSNKEQTERANKKNEKEKTKGRNNTKRKERRNKTKLAVIWVYESCSLVTKTYQRYVGYSCLHLQGKNRTFDIFVCHPVTSSITEHVNEGRHSTFLRRRYKQ